MNKALLTANGIHRRYPMGRTELHVLRGCDLRVEPGEFLAIMGRSGSGKSTLLHILGALDLPQAGEVSFAGVPVCGTRSRAERFALSLNAVLRVIQRILLFVVVYIIIPACLITVAALLLLALVRPLVPQTRTSIPPGAALLAVRLLRDVALAALVGHVVLGILRLLLVTVGDWRRDRLRRRDFGFVFQFYHLLPELNVLENVLLPRMVGVFSFLWWNRRRTARAEALNILQRVGLAERLRHKPSELSGGERQRVAIARALAHRPQILFADEPTGNLDAEAGANIMSILTDLHREGQTIVMVTHDPGIAEYADRILRLENGHLHP